MRNFYLTTAALAVLSFPVPAQAAIETYTFDKPHTQVVFFVSHLGFSMSEGEFLDYDGKIVFNTGAPERSSVEVTINTDSIDMGDATWDEHMKAENFFHVAKHPAMTFKSTAIEVTGENTAMMTGDLTLLGVTKSVILDVTYNKSGVHPFSGKYVSGFSARGSLNRSDFGMTYGIPGVGDEVELRLEVEALRDDMAGQGGTNP